ncbi:hypothetical protein V1508DRAFT_463108 [Lipomyces doorenjongii]|uniref:uncharacterized protein n=1 Tax=Lipomyces doorenjongii TaxID=383834 RepID=UPI0034CEE9CA
MSRFPIIAGLFSNYSKTAGMPVLESRAVGLAASMSTNSGYCQYAIRVYIGARTGGDDDVDIDPAAVDEDTLVELAEDEENDFDGFTSDMQFAMNLFQNNERREMISSWRSSCLRMHQKNRTLVQEVKTLQNQRTMPRTWAPWKHPATMYYN